MKNICFKMPAIILLFCMSLCILPSAPLAANATKKPFVTVLNYHHLIPGAIPKNTTSKATIPIAEFEAQMKYLYENGYYTASLKELEDFLYKKRELPEKTVVITFDDGYESSYVYAFPILKKYNHKAVLFTVTSTIVNDEKPFSPARLSILSFAQMKEMRDSGLIEFGSHTFDAHKYIGKKPKLLTLNKQGIMQDLNMEKQVFLKNGFPAPTAIAYPFGRSNKNVLNAAKACGHKIGFTISQGYVYQNSDPMLLNRMIVKPGTWTGEFSQLLRNNSPALPNGFEQKILLSIDSNVAYIKGNPVLLDAAPYVYNGRAMVPLRFVAECLGAKVSWQQSTKKVVVNTPEKSVELPISPNPETSHAIVNGKKIPLDASASIISGRVMVPVRFISETLGFAIDWHTNERLIEINSHLKVPPHNI